MSAENLTKRGLLGALIATSIAGKAMASGGSKSAGPSETNFVAMAQVTATISDNLRPAGIMQVDVGIYTTEDELKIRLSQLRPVLQSKWRSALQGYINRYYIIGMVPDANMLGNLMQKAVDPIIAPNKGRVLIQAIIAR